ncbi:MAG: NAD(P)H-hydrate dehydratase [Caldisericia bacterium]
MKVVDTEKINELDKKMESEFGVSSQILMENAAISVVNFLFEEFNSLNDKKILIFCGGGNNGGDGFAVARKLFSLKARVKVFLLKDKESLKGDAKINFEIINKLGIIVFEKIDLIKIKEEIENSEIIIDAIFGTGLKREIEGEIKEIINLINNSNKYILSIDIPSGINGDNGKEMGISIKASSTVTFGLPKFGNLLLPGYERCGKLALSYISYPEDIYKDIKTQINFPIILPERKKEAHKKDFGDVLFISGSKKYMGAPYFSSYSFLKCGGGYSRLATVKSIVPYLSITGKEVVYYSMDETADGTISIENFNRIMEIVDDVEMVVIGSGMGLNDETQKLMIKLIENIEKPVIIDGDGLTAIKDNLNILKNRKFTTILTPHMGEFSRLIKIEKEEIEKNKIRIVSETSTEFNSIIVLKGYHSLIVYPDGSLFINMSGNPGLAKAGSGDVLNGVICGMYGLGLNIFDSVRMGVFIHGYAADILKERLGEDGITATDLINFLPFIIKKYKEDFKNIKKKYSIEVVV